MNANTPLQDIMPKVSEILKKNWGHLVLNSNDLSIYQQKVDKFIGSDSKIKVVAKMDGGIKLKALTSSAAFWLKMNKIELEQFLGVNVLN